MPRISGEVIPTIPPTAPLSTRLQAEVYALDGDDDEGTSYMTGPAAGPQGRGHVHPYKPCACNSKQGLGLDLFGTTGVTSVAIVAGLVAGGLYLWNQAKKGRL